MNPVMSERLDKSARGVSVCFRFDDPSAISDHGLERRIFALFHELRVPLTAAVIPFSRTRSGATVPLSRMNAPHLIEAGASPFIDIAQHGHSHICRGPMVNGKKSEFIGVDEAEQVSLIEEARKHLSSILDRQINGFVPPWNSYDEATARAVAALGFRYLSAGFEVLKSGDLAVIPRTCTLRNARSAIERSGYFQALSPAVVVVFHPDDFVEFRDPPLADEPPPFTSLAELRGLLEWLNESPRLKPTSLSQLAEQVRSGTPLWNPTDLELPDRVKAYLPSALARSTLLKAVPTILAGSFRSWKAAKKVAK